MQPVSNIALALSGSRFKFYNINKNKISDLLSQCSFDERFQIGAILGLNLKSVSQENMQAFKAESLQAATELGLL